MKQDQVLTMCHALCLVLKYHLTNSSEIITIYSARFKNKECEALGGLNDLFQEKHAEVAEVEYEST